jgi:hypothetical protein
MKLIGMERDYLEARYTHSITAQRCWKLRARLERVGLTAKREEQLNREFGKMVQRRAR